MRCVPFLAWIALSLSACRSAPDLRVMAYNIKHGRGVDGAVDLERIARVIEACEPDVVALQEVDQGCARSGAVDQTAWLGERLGMEAVFGPAREYDGGLYGMAILSRFPIVASTNHTLPPGPAPRTALAVRVRRTDGRELIVVGVHLYRTEEQRLAQARAIVSAVADADVPVLLAGDFNSTPDSPVIALLEETFENVDKGEDRLTFDSVAPSVEIDHVLLRPRDAFARPAVDVIDEPVASDHRPLLFTARLR